ncbi:MAG: hypothetical protein R3A79_19970 [Nannocystaceae bacterium]
MIAESDTAGTDSDTDTSSTTSPTTTLPTTTTTATTSTTTTSESDTDPTSSESDTEATATDTDTTTTTGPECTVNEDCNDGEMCTDGMCVPAEQTLCDRLGGTDGIATLNGAAVGGILVDQRINGYFLNSAVDGGSLLGCLNDQIGEAAGCPDVVYSCQDMLTAHAGLGISTQDFADFAEDYAGALVNHQANNAPELTDEDITTIMTVLGGMDVDIVEDVDSNATVYQRVGRKPAVFTLIGAPGEAGSFVDNVANDVEINGFFANSNFPRLNTCLTRQVSSIDGPIVYGGEVDSPGPGIDEGVASDSPCLDMCTSHAGLVDDMNLPITTVDFQALAIDLVTAMTTAGVTDEDQAAILGVLGPMCTQIVSDPLNCPGIPVQQIEVLNDAVALDIPDSIYDGSIGTMACTTLEVVDPGDNFTFVNNVTLELGLNHTWLGDLVVKVISPDDVVHTVLSRPGLAEAADDGGDCCGKGADLISTSPLMFSDAGVTDAELMGAGLNNSQFVCQDDALCDYFGNKGAASGGATFAESFIGAGVVGNWQVCVGDAGNNDTGSIQSVKFTFDVSEPIGCP